MLDFYQFTHGGKDMESVLNEYGLSAGLTSKFADQAYKNIKFLRMKEYITEEEAQTIMNRVIADIGRAIRE